MVRQFFTYLFVIAFVPVFFGLLAYAGAGKIIIAPFVDLPERVTLVSYAVNTALIITPPLLLGCYIIKLVKMTGKQVKNTVELYLAGFSVVVGLLSIIPRYNLGVRIDEANYVKCIHEYKNARRSGLKVYAADPSLCENPPPNSPGNNSGENE